LIHYRTDDDRGFIEVVARGLVPKRCGRRNSDSQRDRDCDNDSGQFASSKPPNRLVGRSSMSLVRWAGRSQLAD